MFLPRVLQLLVAKAGKGAGNTAAGGTGLYHLVDEAFFGCHKRVGETVFIICRMRGDLFRITQIGAVDDLAEEVGFLAASMASSLTKAREGTLYLMVGGGE